MGKNRVINKLFIQEMIGHGFVQKSLCSLTVKLSKFFKRTWTILSNHDAVHIEEMHLPQSSFEYPTVPVMSGNLWEGSRTGQLIDPSKVVRLMGLDGFALES